MTRHSHIRLFRAHALFRRWSQQKGAEVLAERGSSPERVDLVRRWFNGEFASWEWYRILMRIAGAYEYDPSLRLLVRQLRSGAWCSKVRSEAQIFAFGQLVPG
jgi:hypothetical protein